MSSNYKEIYSKILELINAGKSFQYIKKEQPLLTIGLYKKLGGKLKRRNMRLSGSSSIAPLFFNNNDYQPGYKKSPIDRDLVIGTLLGDGHISPVTNSDWTNTYTYKAGHTWQQISYLYMKYELMKPLSQSVRIDPPRSLRGDYSVHFDTVATESLSFFRELFYTEKKKYKINLQKNVMKKDIVDLLNWRVFSFWLMDDGKKHGSVQGVFSITIGRQEYYTFSIFKEFVSNVSDVLGIPLYPYESASGFSFNNRKESSNVLMEKILEYIHPDFYYKIGVYPEDCGNYYRGDTWYKTWLYRRKELVHPFVENHTIEDYRKNSIDFRMRYRKAVFSQARVRGFFFGVLNDNDLKRSWNNVCSMVSKKDENNVLRCRPIINKFANHFMPHRFKLTHKGKISPYSVFLNNKELRRVIDTLVETEGRISDTSIRSAINTLGTVAMGVYNTGTAKYLIDKYCEGTHVLDPCAGWGNRYVAAVSLGKFYFGIDASKETALSHYKIKDWFISQGISSSEKIVHGRAEDRELYKKEYFDFCLTSPPYYDVEEYSNDKEQSYILYKSYDKWVEGFLYPFLDNVYYALKKDSIFALNVYDVEKNPLVRDSLFYCKKIGFTHKDTYYMAPYRRKMMWKSCSEPILILKKDVT